MTLNDAPPENESPAPAPGTADASSAAATSTRRFGGAAKAIAPIVAAGLVGGGVVFAVDRNSGSPASAGDSPAAIAAPQRAPGGFAGGGLAGEQRIQGTVTAKTATTVTVKSSTGTATYAVTPTTQIVRNGQAAPLSAVQVGDPAFVHVYPSSSGQMLVERLFVGTSAGDGGPRGLGGPGPGGSGSQGGTGTFS